MSRIGPPPPALLFAVALSVSPAVAAGVPFRAGAAKVDVTPPAAMLPIAVNGNFRQTLVADVTDPLHVRCLALSAGGVTVVVGTVDSCLVPRDLFDRAKATAGGATGVPAAHVLLSATHTHSAPAVAGVHGSDAVPEYAAFLEGKIAEAVVAAVGNLAPAEVGWGVADCDEFLYCRRWLMKPGTAASEPFTGRGENAVQMNPGHRNPNKIRRTGPVDPAVTVLSVRSTAGAPIAVLTNWNTHYAGAPGLSADYFGELCRLIEADTDDPGGASPFVALANNGTSGDASAIDYSRDAAVDTGHRVVAARVHRTVSQVLANVEYRRDPPLRAAERLLTLNVRVPDAAETRRARAFLVENGLFGAAGEQRRLPLTKAESYARETVLLAELPATRELKLQAIALGDFAVTAIPCEVYGGTGLELKRRSPFGTTMNVGLANGWEGYLPPPDQFPLGGYTTWRCRASCLEVDAEPKIVAALEELLRSLEP